MTHKCENGKEKRWQLAEKAREKKLFQSCCWCVFTARNLTELGCVGAESDTWFDLASLTKVFTSTAALAVVREKKLSLDQPIDALLRENGSTIPDECTAGAQAGLHRITMRKLLTHTSGLMAWYPFYADGRDFWKIMMERLEEPPQQGMVYSDLNFMLLRELLCCITSLPFETVIQRYVSEPAALKTVSFTLPVEAKIAVCCRDNQIEEKMCADRGFVFHGFRSHDTTVMGQPNDGNAFYYFHGISGHAGLFGTVDGVARLGQFYLEEKNRWFRQALPPQPGCEGRCLGFHTGVPFPRGCGHTGFTGTSIWIDSQTDSGMVILTNRLMCGGTVAPDLTEFRLMMHNTRIM